MWRRILTVVFVLLFTIIGYSIIDYGSQPRPYKWRYSYDNRSKQPYGTKVFFDQIHQLFPGQEVKKLNGSNFYSLLFQNTLLDSLSLDELSDQEELDSIYYNQDSAAFNIILMSNFLNGNNYSFDALISHVVNGGNVHVFASRLHRHLAERLNVSIQSSKSYHSNDKSDEDKDSLYFSDNETPYMVRSIEYLTYIDFYDSSNVKVLVKNTEDLALGVQMNLGAGSISIYTIPQIFTNYDLLYSGSSTVERIIQDLPLRTTYFAKDLDFQTRNTKSLLYFIHSYSALKWAYYLILFAVLLFLILSLQRKQRIVPIVEPPKNLSLSFLETISDLHLAKKDYHSILKRKMNFLLTSIKSEYHLSSEKLDKFFIEQLSKRSHKDKKKIAHLFNYYNKVISSKEISPLEFKVMCKLFQLFKN